MFRVFKYKIFRFFFSSLLFSQLGIWIQNVAILWLIYNLTSSPFIMGLSVFINTLPLFIFTPFAGVIIDKFDRYKLILAVQLLFTLQALILLLLAFFNLIHLWNIILLSFFLNTIVALDGPLRQSSFILFVKGNKSDLSNAIALNSSCFNVVKFLGPTIAGLLMTYTTIQICFLINFLLLIIGLFLIKHIKIEDTKTTNNESVLNSLKAGFKYAINTREIFFLQSFLACFCFFAMSYTVFTPIYTKTIFLANADTFGFLMGAIGVGALCSSLLVAIKKSIKNLKTLLFLSCFLFSISIISLALIKSIPIAMFFAFLMGMSLSGFLTPQIILLQNVIKENMYGKIMSFNTICILGTTSLSSFFIGSLIECFGISKTLMIDGILLTIVTIYFIFVLKRFK